MVHVVVQSQPARVGESREGGEGTHAQGGWCGSRTGGGLMAVGVLHVQHLMQYGG